MSDGGCHSRPASAGRHSSSTRFRQLKGRFDVKPGVPDAGESKEGTSMRKAIVVAVSAVTAVAAIAATVASADTARVASPAAPNCRLATIGVAGPFTGPAASAGLDQRNWARVFLTNWNGGRALPGVPRSLKRTKLKYVEADTQLNPQVAATVAVQMRSNRDVVAVNA